ncbi:MAG: hypothetical protein ACE5E6_06270 [Phycisphaerae bacterium]
MSPHDEHMHDIAAGESWLRAVAPDHGRPDVASVKRRVRVALQEAWLADTLRDHVPPELGDRVKRRVRSALNAAGHGCDAAEPWAGHATVAEPYAMVVCAAGPTPTDPTATVPSEADAARVVIARRVPGWGRWIIGVAGVAAALALAVVGLQQRGVADATFTRLDAFEQYADAWAGDDLASPLAMLDEQVLELELDVFDDGVGGAVGEDILLDDVREAIDGLSDDSGASDWS